MMLLGMAERSLKSAKKAFALRDICSALDSDPTLVEARYMRAQLYLEKLK